MFTPRINFIVSTVVAFLSLCALIVPSSASAYCVTHTQWRYSPEEVIPYFIVVSNQSGFNQNTVGLDPDVAHAQIFAAAQRWNEAATGLKPLVFAGFTNHDDPVSWSDNSITILTLPPSVMGNSAGNFRFTGEGTRRAELAIMDAVKNRLRWVTDPDTRPDLSTASDFQAVLVHEFGHAAGLGHPWLATPVAASEAFPNAAPDRCVQGAGPAGSAGQTVGTMTYWSEILEEGALDLYPRLGLRRTPWKDDIVGATIAHGNRHWSGQSCTTTADCTQCPTGDPDPPGAPCEDDADCPASQHCETGDPIPCGPDFECPSGLACDLQTLECGPGPDVGDKPGTCEPCLPGEPCFIPNNCGDTTCLYTTVMPRNCTADTDCAGVQECQGGVCSSDCVADEDCGADEVCEQKVRGVEGDGTGKEHCESDAQCPADHVCDVAGSRLCIATGGSCRRRMCALPYPDVHAVQYWEGAGKTQSYDGPINVPQPSPPDAGSAVFSTGHAPAASGADDFDTRRLSLAGTGPGRTLQYTEALDGAWCSELDSPVVDVDGTTPRTYARPAVARCNGRAVIAWLAEEEFDGFGSTIRFAQRSTFSTAWELIPAEVHLQDTRTFSMSCAEGPDKIIVVYLDRNFTGQVRMVDPESGEVSAETSITKAMLGGMPLNDVGRPICSGDRCAIPATRGEGGLSMSLVAGDVDADGFDPDQLGSPPFFNFVSNAGDIDGAYRGTSTDAEAWISVLSATPSADAPAETTFITGGGMGLTPVPGPVVSGATTLPKWAPGLGTFATEFAGDSLRAFLFRGMTTLDQPAPVGGFAPTVCCTPSECGPVDPSDDPAFECDDFEDGAGTVGCPCAPIVTDFDQIEACAITGDADDCAPIMPDGRHEAFFCMDGTGDHGNAVTCDTTPSGNPICRECGVPIDEEGSTFGCPCDEIECDTVDLGCWGETLADGGTDPSQGRCWEIDAPPPWVCVENCGQLVPAVENGYGLVCVGPHLSSEFYSGGSAYNLTVGELSGHPSYCTSIDCAHANEITEGGVCEEASNGTEVCVGEDQCGKECESSQDCWDRGFPSWYSCAGNGVDRCLPVSACDGSSSC